MNLVRAKDANDEDISSMYENKEIKEKDTFKSHKMHLSQLFCISSENNKGIAN